MNNNTKTIQGEELTPMNTARNNSYKYDGHDNTNQLAPNKETIIEGLRRLDSINSTIDNLDDTITALHNKLVYRDSELPLVKDANKEVNIDSKTIGESLCHKVGVLDDRISFLDNLLKELIELI